MTLVSGAFSNLANFYRFTKLQEKSGSQDLYDIIDTEFHGSIIGDYLLSDSRVQHPLKAALTS
jgi:hypothetical protein